MDCIKLNRLRIQAGRFSMGTRDKRVMRKLSVPGILLMAILLVSCAGLLRYDVQKFYAGPPLPREQIAILITSENVRISRINAASGGLINLVTISSLMELLPGRYLIEVNYDDTGTYLRTYSSAPVKMEVDVKPGRIYEMHAIKPERGTWYPDMRDVTGQKWFEEVALASRARRWERERSSNSKIAFLESFDRGDRGWTVHESRDVDAHFSSGLYILKTKNDRCVTEIVPIPISLPENFEIELKSSWNAGLDNIPYGLVIGSGSEDSCRFHISKNGCASASAVIDGTIVSRMDWTCGGAAVKYGADIRQTVEARGRFFRYYVNGELAGSLFLYPERMELKVIGVTVCGPQKVSFDELKIVTY